MLLDDSAHKTVILQTAKVKVKSQSGKYSYEAILVFDSACSKSWVTSRLVIMVSPKWVGRSGSHPVAVFGRSTPTICKQQNKFLLEME